MTEHAANVIFRRPLSADESALFWSWLDRLPSNPEK